MSELPLDGAIPQWTLADRMRKARTHAGLEQGELAAEIGIARSSVVNYENGHTRPSRPVLLSWAWRCKVSPEWLIGLDPNSGRGRVKGQAGRGFRTTRSSTFRSVRRRFAAA
jgi:transcriptional regulator with XRE-family HTH domain